MRGMYTENSNKSLIECFTTESSTEIVYLFASVTYRMVWVCAVIHGMFSSFTYSLVKAWFTVANISSLANFSKDLRILVNVESVSCNKKFSCI